MIVAEEHNGMRLDAFLAQVEAYSSRSIAATFCDNQKVLVNGVAKPKSFKLTVSDDVT